MPSPLTQAQRRTLFMAAHAAARARGEQPEAYRKRAMSEELGVEHLAQVSSTTGFDALMARFSRDSGDVSRAAHYATQAVHRLQYVILEAARRLAPADPYAYVAGVMIQSRIAPVADTTMLSNLLRCGSAWSDVPVPHLRRVLMMLKTHLRRRHA